MTFLINDCFFESNPSGLLQDPSFPLDVAGFTRLTLNEILLLAREEFDTDANFAASKPNVAGNISRLIAAKSTANALRLWRQEGVAGVEGVHAKLASLSIDLVADLSVQFQLGQLTMDFLNRNVWAHVR